MQRPTPLSPAGDPVDQRTPAHRAARDILEGRTLVVTDRLQTARSIHTVLRQLLDEPDDDAPFAERQRFRRALDATAERLRVPVQGGRLLLDPAPEIGFLSTLYPESERFELPYRDVRRMAAAWPRFEQGVHLPVLGHRLHPWFGTYVPTRLTHLELFAQWLASDEGPRSQCADVGTGSGVLALMLARKGASRVVATDSNPAAVHSTSLEAERHDYARGIVQAVHTPWLQGVSGPFDLIVCNPPWSHGTPTDDLQAAQVFDDAFFPALFDQARRALAPNGRLVILFSDLIRLTQPEVEHPIDAALASGRWSSVQTLRRKVPASRTRSGRTRRTRERVEVHELVPTGSGAIG
jgi:SAM-dependent methyltransferase